MSELLPGQHPFAVFLDKEGWRAGDHLTGIWGYGRSLPEALREAAAATERAAEMSRKFLRLKELVQ